MSSSNSWGGLNDACRAGCQIPCQTEYAACEVGWAACKAVCWLGCSCPDCGGARDSCLNACQGTCHYDLHANVGLKEVDGLGGTTVTDLGLNLPGKTFTATLAVPALHIKSFVDVSVIPTINSVDTVSPLKVDTSFSYSCPSPGVLALKVTSLHASPVDLDNIFTVFHSVAGQIPFGLGDAFNGWLSSIQQLISGQSMPACACDSHFKVEPRLACQRPSSSGILHLY